MAQDGDRLPVLLMASIPVLAVKFGWGFLRFQAGRKRGVRTFRKALVRSGLPLDEAARLAQTYHEAGSVRKLFQGVRFLGT